jgi:hypothetical protein
MVICGGKGYRRTQLKGRRLSELLAQDAGLADVS